VKFSAVIDLYVADRRSQGRINSPNTETAYRRVLNLHCDDVNGRDPAKTGRNDIKTTLRRWQHPNSQRQAHAVLTSFYDWAMEESIRETNPARMVIRARPRKPAIYRPTRTEVIRLMDASNQRRRDRWVIHLGVLAGLRRQELRLLQGRHLANPGWIWVSPDIAKRSRERWLPIPEELQPIINEILATVGPGDYVTPTRKTANLQHTEHVEQPDKPISGSGLYQLVKRVGKRANLGHSVTPHTLRHAYGDHTARYAGLRAAQELLGHESVATTEGTYTGRVSRDELAISIQGFRYRPEGTPPTQLQPECPLIDATDNLAPRPAPNPKGPP
jgi:integrase/recombinase XerD